MRVFVFSLISFICGIVLTVLFLRAIEAVHEHKIEFFYDTEMKKLGMRVGLKNPMPDREVDR